MLGNLHCCSGQLSFIVSPHFFCSSDLKVETIHPLQFVNSVKDTVATSAWCRSLNEGTAPQLHPAPPPQVTPAPSVSAPRGVAVKAGAGKLTSCHMFPSREVKAAPQLFNYPGCQRLTVPLQSLLPPGGRVLLGLALQNTSTPASSELIHFLLPVPENETRRSSHANDDACLLALA